MAQSITAPKLSQLYVADSNPLQRIRLSAEAWPERSAGDSQLAHMQGQGPEGLSQKTHLRFEVYQGTIKGDPHSVRPSKVEASAIRRRRSVTRSFVRAYRNSKEWADGLEATVCGFDCLQSAAVVCITIDEQQRLKVLLQHLAAQHECFGLQLPDARILLIEELNGQRFCEVFASPEISPHTTSREQRVMLLEATEVGLHFVRHSRH